MDLSINWYKLYMPDLLDLLGVLHFPMLTSSHDL